MVSVSQLFRNWSNNRRIGASACDVVAATRSDTVDETGGIARGIYLDSSGDVKFTSANGTDVGPLTGLATGVVIPFAVRRIWSTGTTVTAGNVYVCY